MYGTAGVNVCAVVDIEPIISGPGALRINVCVCTRVGHYQACANDARHRQRVAFVHCLRCWWSLGQKSPNASRTRAAAVERSALTSRSVSPAISLRVGVAGTRCSLRGNRLVHRVMGDVGNTDVMNTSECEC